MENKVFNTLLGEIRIIREEKETVTVIYKGVMSHMHKDFLRLLIAMSEKHEFKNAEKFEVISKNERARNLYGKIFGSKDCRYTLEEVRDISFAYAIFLEGNKG